MWGTTRGNLNASIASTWRLELSVSDEKSLTCITTRLSALPVRISYRVNVRSEPMLARTDDSLRLKRTAVIVSVEVGNVRSDIGELLRGC